MCAQIMGRFSSFFRSLLCSYHNILYSCSSQDLWSSWFNCYPLIACFNWYLLIACFFLCCVLVAYHSFSNLGASIQLVFLQVLPLDMCIAFHSLVEKYTIWRNTFYIGLLSFSPILAIDANGGEVSESFVEKFRESSFLALVVFPSFCISYACIIGCCIA